MPSLTTDIAGSLLRLDKSAQREAFALIMAFLCQQTGEDVTSLHDFITGRSARRLTTENRERLLSQIASALRSGDVSSLNPTT